MSAAPGIAICNVSTLLSQADAEKMVAAVAKQSAEFCAAWSRLYCGPVFYAAAADVPLGMATIFISDDSPEANDLGFHTVAPGGWIGGIVAVRPVTSRGGHATTGGAMSVSAVLSHEVLELTVDPFCNFWADAPDGRSLAFEVCDPCQGYAYEIDGVSVSDWVTPAFFQQMPAIGAKFSRTGLITSPFSLGVGGYCIQRQPGGQSETRGEKAPWRSSHSLSRSSMRLQSQ